MDDDIASKQKPKIIMLSYLSFEMDLSSKKQRESLIVIQIG
jgi:hypothetical protein